MTFAEKLLAVAKAKVGIREAIIAKGVNVDVSVPFDEYPGRIMMIDGVGGEQPDIPKAEVTSGFSVSESSVLVSFIPVHEVAFAESFSICGITSETGCDTLFLIYPPTNDTAVIESAVINGVDGFTSSESAAFEFSLFAFAESFKTHTAFKYEYDNDWVEFTKDGAYVKDRTVVNIDKGGTATENGVYFSAPLPNRRSYANIINLSVKAVRNG